MFLAHRLGEPEIVRTIERRTPLPEDQYVFHPHVTVEPSGGLAGVQVASVRESGTALFHFDVYARLEGEGPAFPVNETTRGFQANPVAGRLANGGVVVVWQDGSPLLDIQARDPDFVPGYGDYSGERIQGRILNGDGTFASHEFTIHQSNSSRLSPNAIVSLTGGRFMVVGTADRPTDDRGGDRDAVGCIFNDDGTPAGTRFVLGDHTEGVQQNVLVHRLTDGSFLTVWNGVNESSFQGISAQRFAPDGTKMGHEFAVNTTTAGHQSSPRISSRPDGGFAISWVTDFGTEEEPCNVMSVRMFDAAGNMIGREISIEDAIFTELVWTGARTFDGVLGPLRYTPELYAYQATPFGIDFVHRTVLRGTATGDIIRIDEPNTLYSGRAGDDHMTGSIYADELRGDGGDDLLRGRAGHDTMTGGTGDDLLLGGSDRDLLDGGAGNDRLIGGAGADDLRGGAGDDIYWIDSGLDCAIEAAGEGNDRLVSATVAITLPLNVETGIAAGSAPVNLWGNRQDNVLRGNASHNGIGGREGRDIMIGGGGSDGFRFDSAADSGASLATADLILDFRPGTDHISLFGLRLDDGTWHGRALGFLDGAGMDFSGAAGEVRWYRIDRLRGNDDRTVVEIDFDGDAAVDMAIALRGLVDLTAGDFIF